MTKPTDRFRLRERAVLILGTVAALMLLAGCAHDSSSGSVPSPVIATESPSSASSGETMPPDEPSGDGSPLRLVAWGYDGTHLSMIVRNASDHMIRAARVLIEVYDPEGRLELATSGPATSKCCTILGLPPGKQFGLYLPAISPAQVGSVKVKALKLRTEPWHGKHSVATASRWHLTRGTDDVVVDTLVRIHGPATPYVVGQAFLTDRAGHLRAVTSGRYYCFGRQTKRRIKMHLTFSAPPGTIVSKVVAYPIPRNEPTLVGYRCH